MRRLCDISSYARENCLLNADLNGVQDRVKVQGLYDGANFALLPEGKTLILCDIEGDEEELIDPEKYPALKKLDIIVEIHDLFRPKLSEQLIEKFKPTHEIVLVKNNNAPKVIKLPDPLTELSELDQFLLGYEGRCGPTPWAVMKVKQ